MQKLIFVLAGVLVGAAEYAMLAKLTSCLTAKNGKSTGLLIFLKLILYALSISVLMFFFSDMLLYSGIGFAAGMLVTGIVIFILQSSRSGTGKTVCSGKDDKEVSEDGYANRN